MVPRASKVRNTEVTNETTASSLGPTYGRSLLESPQELIEGLSPHTGSGAGTVVQAHTRALPQPAAASGSVCLPITQGLTGWLSWVLRRQLASREQSCGIPSRLSQESLSLRAGRRRRWHNQPQLCPWGAMELALACRRGSSYRGPWADTSATENLLCLTFLSGMTF